MNAIKNNVEQVNRVKNLAIRVAMTVGKVTFRDALHVIESENLNPSYISAPRLAAMVASIARETPPNEVTKGVCDA